MTGVDKRYYLLSLYLLFLVLHEWQNFKGLKILGIFMECFIEIIFSKPS